MKFYTEKGNWDLVGNNTPIFFIRDPILFPSFIHTQKRNPKTHLKVNSCFEYYSLFLYNPTVLERVYCNTWIPIHISCRCTKVI